jgi:hypothetical protein
VVLTHSKEYASLAKNSKKYANFGLSTYEKGPSKCQYILEGSSVTLWISSTRAPDATRYPLEMTREGTFLPFFRSLEDAMVFFPGF